MTQQRTESASVTVDVVVEVPQDRAFEVFTDDFDAIKPREHNLLAVDIARTVLEGRVGGSIYDVGVDGSECRWARVLAFEPPHRLLFSWDISPRWQLETDPARSSEVEVRFIEVAPGRTRVELEHRHLDRHGDGWESARDGVSGDGGWPLYLSRFEAAIKRPRGRLPAPVGRRARQRCSGWRAR